MSQLVLLRHGQSIWNRRKRFTGWTDVPLTAKGKRQASGAGRALRQIGFKPDVCFSSRLCRAVDSLSLVLRELDAGGVTRRADWRLNERHYGKLQGMTPTQAVRAFGAGNVLGWQRQFSERPPSLDPGDDRHPSADARYADVPASDLPVGESVQDTLSRLLPFWEQELVPRLAQRQNILIVSHANTLRALISHFEAVPPAGLPRILVPIARPLLYEHDGLKVRGRRQAIRSSALQTLSRWLRPR